MAAKPRLVPLHLAIKSLAMWGLLSTGTAMADTPNDLYLQVNLNGQPTQLVSHVSESNGHLSIDGQSLAELGLNIQTLGVRADQQIQLDDIPELEYHYDVSQQSLDLQVPDRLRNAQRLGGTRAPTAQASAADHGLVLNYDAYLQHQDNANALSLFSEERYFNAKGVFSNTGTAYTAGSDNRQHYVRYDSSWSHSDPASMTTWQLGDTINTSLDWSRSVRLGGVQWKSNFALRPDLVTFPLQSYSGSAVVPSAVNLYVNGVQQYSGNVSNGPYVINQVVPGITGAGEATVVTRDALGRSISTTVPLYVDTRLAAPGLPSYSAEVGYLRHDYSLASFNYAPRLASSASLRYGMSNDLTLEGHSEITSGLFNAGGGALWRYRQAGVFNASLAASGGGDSGLQLGVGYQYTNPRFSFNVQSLRASRGYGDLGSRDGSALPTVSDRMTVSLPVARRQSVSLSYIGYKLPGIATSNVVSVAHSVSLSNSLSVSLNVFQDIKQPEERGAFVSVSFSLGQSTSVTSSVNYQNGQSSSTVSATDTPDYAGGWGWAAQRSASSASTYQLAQVQYLGNHAHITATAQQAGGQNLYTADLSGALVLMDGNLATARQIGDGFALVSTDGVAGIPVIHENRQIGTTDSSGHFLVPDLDAYRNNQLSIDSLGLPADVNVSSTRQQVMPQALSGVLVNFPVKRYSAASIILQTPDGQVVPAGTQVRHLESGTQTLVGYDGLTFIDGLKAHNHLRLDSRKLHCEVTFDFPHRAPGTLPTLGPFTCQPTEPSAP